MKQIFRQYFSCWALVFFLAAPGGAMAHPHLIRISDSESCLDSMETVPIDDNLVPTEIAVDGGCMVPEAVITI